MGRVAAHAYKHLQAGQPPHHLGWLPPKLHKKSPETVNLLNITHIHTRMHQTLPESRGFHAPLSGSRSPAGG